MANYSPEKILEFAARKYGFDPGEIWEQEFRRKETVSPLFEHLVRNKDDSAGIGYLLRDAGYGYLLPTWVTPDLIQELGEDIEEASDDTSLLRTLCLCILVEGELLPAEMLARSVERLLNHGNLSVQAAAALVLEGTTFKSDNLTGIFQAYLESEAANLDDLRSEEDLDAIKHGLIWKACSSVLRLAKDSTPYLELLPSVCELNRFYADQHGLLFGELAVKSLSRETAAFLGGLKGCLTVGDLSELSPEAAKSLISFDGTLYFSEVYLPEETVSVLCARNNTVWMNEELRSETLARKYTEDSNIFDDPGLLQRLSDSAAECLIEKESDLYLSGLETLSDAAAESLSRHKHGLYLDGLTSLSDAAAENLSRLQQSLSLMGLTRLSVAAAESLSKHNSLFLDLDNLPGSAAKILRDAGHGEDDDD